MIAEPPVQLRHLASNELIALGDFITRLKEQFGQSVLHVWLFGSKARGDSDAESDIDVLVVLKDSDSDFQQRVDSLSVDINLRYGILLSDHIVDWKRYVQMRDWQEPIFSDIQRDGVDLWKLELSPAI